MSTIQELQTDHLVELFQLDVNNLNVAGDTERDIIYFCSERINDGDQIDGVDHLTVDGAGISWDSNLYKKIPLEASGFSSNLEGKLPRPQLTVSAIVSTFFENFDDYSQDYQTSFIGAKLSRYRVFNKNLDGRSEADTDLYFGPDIYILNKKLSHNRFSYKYELVSILDLEYLKFPFGRVTRNIFPSSGVFFR